MLGLFEESPQHVGVILLLHTPPLFCCGPGLRSWAHEIQAQHLYVESFDCVQQLQRGVRGVEECEECEVPC